MPIIIPVGGQALRQISMPADQGFFSINGQSVLFGATFPMSANSGSLDVAGQVAELKKQHKVLAVDGSFSIVGQDATLANLGRLFSADAGTFATAGESVRFLVDRVMSAENGSISISGQSFTRTYRLVADQGQFPEAGQIAALIADQELKPYRFAMLGSVNVSVPIDALGVIGSVEIAPASAGSIVTFDVVSKTLDKAR